LNRYNQEFASNEYTNAYNRFNANRDRRYNRLAGVAQTGQTATRDIAQMGTQNAQARGELGMGAASARGSGYVGMANAINSGVGNYLTLSQLGGSTPPPNIGSRLGQATMAGATAGYMPSDRRLKTNVTQIGTADNGLPLYRYNYLWGGPQHIGHMAHEVARKFPDAVATSADGFLMVDYSKV
jgi:hypothetical protein